MNIADEATTAHLGVRVQSCRTVSEFPQQAGIQAVNDCLKKWGLPENIKIDNGLPFVNPKYRTQPTIAKLWWTGLGINVIQNRARCPQQNGVVECLQGVLCSWSNPKAQENKEALQKRLNQESLFQREQYRIPAKGYKTRIEIYPELKTNSRKYNPDKFDMKLVYKYLSKFVWKRTVKQNGMLKLFSNTLYAGEKNYRKPVFITFDPVEIKWLIKDTNGILIYTSKRGIPTEKEIKDFALCQ